MEPLLKVTTSKWKMQSGGKGCGNRQRRIAADLQKKKEFWPTCGSAYQRQKEAATRAPANHSQRAEQ